MQKIDLKKELKHLCGPFAKVVIQTDVPTFQFLMMDGEGDPDRSQAHAQAAQALFAVSYTAKFNAQHGGCLMRHRREA